ncbi:hypothetical protein Clacol_006089 [Clathrus columnatus]|uniref:Uncharacterized protein n=1 Tax=Clathrus columnatus TaxID=1419009 RepID=A0AAV5AB34_9AGAM|nr:hypothetical protein Clacol_006089 [Clathrus columnatus]
MHREIRNQAGLGGSQGQVDTGSGKKKLAAQVVVNVPEKWLRNLDQSKKVNTACSKASTATIGKSGCIAKTATHAQVVDFYASNDNYGSGGSDDDNGEYDIEISSKRNALITELENCNQCNANKDPESHIPCLVNKNGIHKKVSHEMIMAWVLAIMKNESGVTLNVPPKRDPFLEFHYFIPGAPVSSTMGLPTAPILRKCQDHQEVEQEMPQANIDCHVQSLPPVSTNYGNPPTWLTSLEEVKRPDEYNFEHFQSGLDHEGCLSITIDTLAELPEPFWGDLGLKFNIGEIAWLKKNLRKSMEKIESI